jgi:hypothetical protein
MVEKARALRDIDYVERYAERLSKDNSLFRQHKILLESQMQASIFLFRRRFGTDEEFKRNAREYLREIGLI